MRCCKLLGAVLYLTLCIPGISAETGVQSIKVRDLATHYAIKAELTFVGPASVSEQADDNGAVNISLPAGEYQVVVSAPGFKTMTFTRNVTAGRNLPGQIMLEPLKPPAEEQSVATQLRPGYTLLRGYAVDEQGHPVTGVRVHAKNADAEAITNERGYYVMSVPTPRPTARDYAGTDTLVAEKPGYKVIVYRNIVLAGQDGGGWTFDMQRGSGVVESNELPMSLRETDEHRQVQPSAFWITITTIIATVLERAA